MNLAVIQIRLKRCNLEEMSLFSFTKFDRFVVKATVIILDDLLLLSDNVCKISASRLHRGLMLVFESKSEKIDIFNLFGTPCSILKSILTVLLNLIMAHTFLVSTLLLWCSLIQIQTGS